MASPGHYLCCTLLLPLSPHVLPKPPEHLHVWPPVFPGCLWTDEDIEAHSGQVADPCSQSVCQAGVLLHWVLTFPPPSGTLPGQNVLEGRKASRWNESMKTAWGWSGAPQTSSLHSVTS